VAWLILMGENEFWLGSLLFKAQKGDEK
jgi:hypothetical protein